MRRTPRSSAHWSICATCPTGTSCSPACSSRPSTTGRRGRGHSRTERRSACRGLPIWPIAAMRRRARSQRSTPSRAIAPGASTTRAGPCMAMARSRTYLGRDRPGRRSTSSCSSPTTLRRTMAIRLATATRQAVWPIRVTERLWCAPKHLDRGDRIVQSRPRLHESSRRRCLPHTRFVCCHGGKRNDETKRVVTHNTRAHARLHSGR